MFTPRRASRRRFRAPVISRLSLAWAGFAFLCAIAAGMAAIDGQQHRRQKIAVSYDETIKQITQPKLEAPAPLPLLGADVQLNSVGEFSGRKAASVTQAGLNTESGSLPRVTRARNTEQFTGFDDNTPFSNEIVITIDGAPPKRPGDRDRLTQPQATIQPALSEPIAEPRQSLLRKTAFGAAPMRAKGARPALAYAKPFDHKTTAPKVALIVGGLGLNATLTEKAIEELPSYVTLAFAPYGKDLQYWADKARADGHETVLELPMEAHQKNAPLGPAALLEAQTQAQNIERLDWLLSRFKGFFAVTNYRGEKFTASNAMNPILMHLSRAGVAYIDDTGVENPGRLVGPVSGDWLSIDYLINASAAPGDNALFNDSLEKLEQKARDKGAAIAKTYAHDSGIEALALWSASLNERGFVMAPASALLPHHESAL